MNPWSIIGSSEKNKTGIFALLIVLFFLFMNSAVYGQSEFTEEMVDKLTVHFAYDKYAIQDSDKIKIKLFIDGLDVVTPYVFRIQSHTDSIGSLEYNQKLSEQRSFAIRDYLLSVGVPGRLISTKGIGKVMPIRSNESDEGRAINRRSNIFVFEIQKQRLFKSRVVLDGVKKSKAMVYIQTDENIDSVATDDNGNFAFIIPENKDVTYGVFAPGFMFSTRKINTNVDLPIQDIRLNKIKKGEKISLQNLYFVGNQAVLLAESKPELINLLRFIKQNPNLKLEIGGHVNGPAASKGDPKWYYNLALDRTRSIKKYLVNHDLNPDNFICKSYSNTQMIYPEAVSEAEAKLNRRVEIKVLE